MESERNNENKKEAIGFKTGSLLFNIVGITIILIFLIISGVLMLDAIIEIGIFTIVASSLSLIPFIVYYSIAYSKQPEELILYDKNYLYLPSIGEIILIKDIKRCEKDSSWLKEYFYNREYGTIIIKTYKGIYTVKWVGYPNKVVSDIYEKVIMPSKDN